MLISIFLKKCLTVMLIALIKSVVKPIIVCHDIAMTCRDIAMTCRDIAMTCRDIANSP